MNTPAHHEKSALAIVIIFVALAILYVFWNYQDFLWDSNDVPRFVILASVALGLMLVLFYMVSERAAKHVVKTSSSRKSSSKKSSRKRR